jgi:hypothetical protein|tara:strand:+ start:512 stop:706 length:195 start_codon:yes stop_codon:yes gene_type:complete
MNQRILSQIKQIEDQIAVLSERAYNPQLSDSEQKEIAKRKKKLKKTKQKLFKRIDKVQDIKDTL